MEIVQGEKQGRWWCFIKTPHRITLVESYQEPVYNPKTGDYDEVIGLKKTVPCLVNFINQAKIFEEYGNRTDKVMICRFNNRQGPFQKAIYAGEEYVPVEMIDIPKKAVRLKWTGGTV